MSGQMVFVVKLGNSAMLVHDTLLVIARSADAACAKVKHDVDFSDYDEGTVIVSADALGGTVVE